MMPHPRGKIVIPNNCPPLVRAVFEEMNRQKIAIHQVAKTSGIARSVIQKWRRRPCFVANLEAVGNTVGLELCWRPRETVIEHKAMGR